MKKSFKKQLLLLFLLFPFCLFAQETAITGKVTDPGGEPLIGVNVSILNTSKGSITDAEGQFFLSGKKGDVLQFSYIGYVSKEVKADNDHPLRIILEEDLKMLDEVVVIGYGTVAKKELTSAVSHVSSKDMLQIGGNNPIMQVQGKVSGVSISNTASSDPNNSTSIQVRGVSSRTAGLGPLIVIDGVPGGNLENLNENDIASIDILKGGAASAIYGTRGSNGVVIVTTKKGSTDGSVHTSYSGYISLHTPQRQIEVLDAEGFIKHNRGVDFGADTDWFKEITRTALTHSHTLQISGGTAKNNYRATVDVKDAEGIDIRSDRKEVGARLTLNHTAKSDLYQITLNAAPRTIEYNNADHMAFWQALTLNPTMPVMDPDEPGVYYETTGWEARNPVELLKIEKSGGEIKYIDWDATFKLNLLPLLGNNNDHSLNTQITIAQQINDWDKFWFRPSTSTEARKSGFTGEANREYDKNKQESLEWLFNYIFNKNDHNVKLMGGYSYQYFMKTHLKAENKDFASDALEYNNLGSGTYMSQVAGRLGMESSKSDSKLIAFFGRLSYDYLGKYFMTASLRYEGSSKFGANNKWGYFPAVSAGWRMSEETFIKDISWINELKIRADYGVTGNQDFDSYKSLASMQGWDMIYYQGKYIRGWSYNKNINDDLSWEKGKNFNVGVDFSLLNNRLAGSLNYYHRKQQDLLGDYNVAIPPNGEATTYLNVGTMKNTGLEIELDIEAVRRKNFNYNIGVIGSTQSNKFVSFSNSTNKGQSFYWQDGFPAPGSPGSVQRLEEGERIGNYVTFKYAGVDDGGNWLIYNKDGDVVPIIQGTDDDKKVVGNGLPKFTMSMTHTLRYRDFDLNLFFRGNFGYQVYDIHTMYWGLQSAAPNLNVLKTAYTTNADVTTGMNQHNSYFVHDGDFLKLDVATLGYTIPVDSKWIYSVRAYFTGRNLFTITGYDGVDLDMFAVNGLQPGIPPGKKSYYPSTKQFLFGVQLNF